MYFLGEVCLYLSAQTHRLVYAWQVQRSLNMGYSSLYMRHDMQKFAHCKDSVKFMNSCSLARAYCVPVDVLGAIHGVYKQ